MKFSFVIKVRKFFLVIKLCILLVLCYFVGEMEKLNILFSALISMNILLIFLDKLIHAEENRDINVDKITRIIQEVNMGNIHVVDNTPSFDIEQDENVSNPLNFNNN